MVEQIKKKYSSIRLLAISPNKTKKNYYCTAQKRILFYPKMLNITEKFFIQNLDSSPIIKI